MTNAPRLRPAAPIPQLSERYAATPPVSETGDNTTMPQYGTTKAAQAMRTEDRKSDAVRELIDALHTTPHPDPIVQVCLMLTLETLNRRAKR